MSLRTTITTAPYAVLCILMVATPAVLVAGPAAALTPAGSVAMDAAQDCPLGTTGFRWHATSFASDSRVEMKVAYVASGLTGSVTRTDTILVKGVSAAAAPLCGAWSSCMSSAELFEKDASGNWISNSKSIKSCAALPSLPAVGPLDVCRDGAKLALPITDVIQGNGGSWFQLYQDQQEGSMYLSYSLTTNNLNNGADGWTFGLEIDQAPGAENFVWTSDNSLVTCAYLGHWAAADTDPMDYIVDAGAWGMSGASSCSWSISWELEIGLQVTMLDSGAHVTERFGATVGCSDGVEFDSESLMRGTGTTGTL
ncbi:MAG: hypothetical protein V4510_11945 [bacterium]